MSETTQNPYELLDQGARIDLEVFIGAFMLFDQVHAVHMTKKGANTNLTTKGDVAEDLLPNFTELEVYAQVRQEFIDKAPSGLPKHQA